MLIDVHAQVKCYTKELNVQEVQDTDRKKPSANIPESTENISIHSLGSMKHGTVYMITGPNLGKYKGHIFLSGVCTAKNTTSVAFFYTLFFSSCGS